MNQASYSGAATSTSDLYIGNHYGAGNQKFAGAMDDVRVYNRALSADEITHLYQLGATTKVATTPEPPPLSGAAGGLVGHWTFDGKDMPQGQVNDRSGQGNHGSMKNMATSTAYTEGVLGQALRFDGADDFTDVSAAAAAMQGESSWAVSLWAKASAYVLDKAAFAMHTDGSGATSFLIYPYDTANGNGARVFFDGNIININSTTISPNEFNHFAFVSNSATDHRLYINGKLVGTSVTSKSLDANLNQVVVGAWKAGSQNFAVSVDDVRLYSRALSQDEIKQLYQMGQ